MKRIVVKYGGSSLSTIEKINQVADRLVNQKEDGNQIVCVVSAMGDTTDDLISVAKELTDRPNGREMDMLLATGEQISASLLAMAIQSKGEKAIAMTGFQAGLKTRGRHMRSRVDDVDIKRLVEALKEDNIVIVTGFQGINCKGDITTLGRGGSDTSAVILAAKLNAPCYILTDVKGIYTVDPKIYPQARKLDYLTYEEALEMAYLGAKILEPRSVLIAKKYKVRLYVGLNFGDVVGTYIVEKGDIMEKSLVSNISLSDDVLLVNMKIEAECSDYIVEAFKDLAERDVNVDVITQNIQSGKNRYMSFTSNKDSKEDIEEVLGTYGTSYNFLKDVTKISIVGVGMRTYPEIIAEIFKVFSENKIKFHQAYTSEISISYIIDAIDKEKVVRILAEKFNL